MKKNASSIDTLPNNTFSISGNTEGKLFPSIKQIDSWIDVAKKHKRFHETTKYLIGLKADLVDAGQQVALNSLVAKYLDDPELNVKHMIISAHKDMNISELTGELTDDIIALSK